MLMSKNTLIVQFRQFLYELWVFESGHLFKNEIRLLKVSELLKVEGALLKFLMATFMKVATTLIINFFTISVINYYTIHTTTLNVRGSSHLASQVERLLPKLFLRGEGRSIKKYYQCPFIKF